MLSGIPSHAKRRLSRMRVLVVLDDITDSEQIKTLIGDQGCLGSGSRIIVISRDKHAIIKECNNNIYEVKPLNHKEAIQLFNLNAFSKNHLQKEEEYSELSNMVVKYASGVPLAIKVLSRSLYDKNKDEWKSKLKKLEEMPDARIQDVLEWSFKGLDDDQKDIFLFLACCFKEESKEWITMLLNACGYHIIDGLSGLQDKALITISSKGDISMHDLIRKMGREIVRKESPKYPGQRSHLWKSDDIFEVLENNIGTPAILSICLNMLRLKKDLHLGPQAFVGMYNLKLLQFKGNQLSEDKRLMYPPKKGFKVLPNGLRSFCWDWYPAKSLPLRSCMHNLVELKFTNSSLQKLWEEAQDLPNLKFVDLGCSRDLIELPDLSKAPNLKKILLYGCWKLRHVSLRPSKEKKITIQESSLSIEESEQDSHLDLCGTSSPIKPSFKYYELPSLEFLTLEYCPSLTELPDDIGFYLPSLQVLMLSGTNVVALPQSIKHLSKLTDLYVINCFQLQYIGELPPSIRDFDASNCESLETLQFTRNLVPVSHRECELDIRLDNCVKLDDHELEAVATHYKLKIQRVILAGTKDIHVKLRIPRIEVPELFSRYRATQDLVSVTLKLPLLYKTMGIIFYFDLSRGCDQINRFAIECRIELSNVANVYFTYPASPMEWALTSDHVFFWYESSLSHKIMEKVSRMKASAATDDLYATVQFKLLERRFTLDGPASGYSWNGLKEWGVYLTGTERCPDNSDDEKLLGFAGGRHHAASFGGKIMDNTEARTWRGISKSVVRAPHQYL